MSVVVPAYNAEAFLDEALLSIASQDFRGFEIVVVDDGSTDSTGSILSDCNPAQLRIVTLGQNAGIAVARNLGAQAANGKYIAWLDADDFSYPDRLRVQYEYMERHPKVGLCGTWVRSLSATTSKVWRYPRRPDYLRARMLFDNPFATSSVIVRRDAMGSSDTPFDSSFPPAEDYDLWERISHRWEVANIPRVLSAYRIHAEQTTAKSPQQLGQSISRIQRRQLERLRLDVSGEEWRLHVACGVGWGESLTEEDMKPLRMWLNKIEQANDRLNVYNSSALRSVLSHRYRFVRNKLRPNLLRTGALRLSTRVQ